MKITNRIRGKVAALAGRLKQKIPTLSVIEHGVADLGSEEPMERNGKAATVRTRKAPR